MNSVSKFSNVGKILFPDLFDVSVTSSNGKMAHKIITFFLIALRITLTIKAIITQIPLPHSSIVIIRIVKAPVLSVFSIREINRIIIKISIAARTRNNGIIIHLADICVTVYFKSHYLT